VTLRGGADEATLDEVATTDFAVQMQGNDIDPIPEPQQRKRSGWGVCFLAFYFAMWPSQATFARRSVSD